jgi:hypothetical protein
MSETMEKMGRLVHSLTDKEDHEAVEVSVKVIREMAEALSAADMDRRARMTLEDDIVELQTQRNILLRTQDSLHGELKTYRVALRHAQGKLQSLYRAAGRMREALLDYTTNISLSDAERVAELEGNA